MKKILLIQSRERPQMVETERREYRAALPESVALDFLSALDESRDWNDPASIVEGYDGVIFGGSGEFDLHGGRTEDDVARATARKILDRVTPLVRYVFENKIPTLGVCFGHQLIAEMHGGNIVSDEKQKKAGSYDVALTSDASSDPLFGDLPNAFTAQYGHKDSVTSMPEGAVLLASGPACQFSVLRYGDNVYTTQFHPELTAEDVIQRFETTPGYLPEGVEAKSLVKDSREASTIISRFVDKIVA